MASLVRKKANNNCGPQPLISITIVCSAKCLRPILSKRVLIISIHNELFESGLVSNK